MSDAIIETRHLARYFGATVAVADLSLQVRSGEIFGFLGPNGAGKTTSVKMLLGLVAPTSGSGTVLGAPIGDRAARARIGFLPEHFRFHDCLSARELLRFHGRMHGMRGRDLERRIDDLLVRVDLLDAAERPLREYSKGMMQRAGLAQAIVNRPDLVFLDEPTSGLDPLGRMLVRDIIAELRDAGSTVFLNSHLLGEVEATCDRVAFVKQGRVIQELSLAAVPSCLDVDVRASGVTPQVLAGLAPFASHVTPRPDGTIRMRVAGEELLPRIAQWLVMSRCDLYALHAQRKSLEEWFVEVMGEDQRPG